MMRLTTFFSLVFLLFCSQNAINAQSPYALDWRYSAPAVGVGLSFVAVNQLLWNPRIAGLTEAQVLALNAQDVPAFDRPTIQNYSASARKTSDILLLSGLGTPVLLALDPTIRRDYQTIGTMYAETMLLNYMLTDLTKQLALRPRPFTYNPNVSLAEKMEQDAHLSFFSGHTSAVAAASFFTAKVYHDYHPNNPETPWIWAAAAALPAATAFFRVEGGKHFPSDVLIGYLVGAGVGLLVPELHRLKLK